MKTPESALRAQALRGIYLNEALGREAHADELAELLVRFPNHVLAPSLRVLARSQRIRAMELRGQAAALAATYGTATRVHDDRRRDR